MNLRTHTAGWLGALLFCLATAAQGQALLTDMANAVGGSYGGSPDSASPFTTGAAPLTITRVDVAWETGAGGVNQVGIYTDAAGFPSTTRVGSFFTNPGATTALTTMSYTGSATLAPGTKYWMVVDITDGSDVSWTPSNASVASPATAGASLPAGSAYGDNLILGSWNPDVATLRFALFGAAGVGGPNSAPTLQEWALILLALLVAGVGMQQLRRRS